MNIPDYNTLIHTLNTERTRRKWSYRTLAHHSGVSHTTLKNHFSHTHRMDAHTLIAVTQALGYQLTLTPPTTPPTPHPTTVPVSAHSWVNALALPTITTPTAYSHYHQCNNRLCTGEGE